MHNKQMREMKIAFSWDDGALEDLKLFELHNKYQIPGMFFVPTRNREGRATIDKGIIRRERSEYVQFGGYTENHSYLTNIESDKVDQELRLIKEYLSDILGEEIKHFCLPVGRYNKHILKIVFKYFDTVRAAEIMNFRS